MIEIQRCHTLAYPYYGCSPDLDDPRPRGCDSEDGRRCDSCGACKWRCRYVMVDDDAAPVLASSLNKRASKYLHDQIRWRVTYQATSATRSDQGGELGWSCRPLVQLDLTVPFPPPTPRPFVYDNLYESDLSRAACRRQLLFAVQPLNLPSFPNLSTTTYRYQTPHRRPKPAQTQATEDRRHLQRAPVLRLASCLPEDT